MQVKMEFTGGRGFKVCETAQGRLVVTRVPSQGLQGYFRPREGRAQVWVAAGRYKTQQQVQDAMVDAWRQFVGLDEIRSFA